jgi:hypothetical protein
LLGVSLHRLPSPWSFNSSTLGLLPAGLSLLFAALWSLPASIARFGERLAYKHCDEHKRRQTKNNPSFRHESLLSKK